jgi:hypothetical protein
MEDSASWNDSRRPETSRKDAFVQLESQDRVVPQVNEIQLFKELF